MYYITPGVYILPTAIISPCHVGIVSSSYDDKSFKGNVSCVMCSAGLWCVIRGI